MDTSTKLRKENVTLQNGTYASMFKASHTMGVLKGMNNPPTVAFEGNFLYLLTDCCGASAKGSFELDEDGSTIPAVVCRNCYKVVDESYGQPVKHSDVLKRMF